MNQENFSAPWRPLDPILLPGQRPGEWRVLDKFARRAFDVGIDAGTDPAPIVNEVRTALANAGGLEPQPPLRVTIALLYAALAQPEAVPGLVGLSDFLGPTARAQIDNLLAVNLSSGLSLPLVSQNPYYQWGPGFPELPEALEYCRLLTRTYKKYPYYDDVFAPLDMLVSLITEGGVSKSTEPSGHH